MKAQINIIILVLSMANCQPEQTAKATDVDDDSSTTDIPKVTVQFRGDIEDYTETEEDMGDDEFNSETEYDNTTENYLKGDTRWRNGVVYYKLLPDFDVSHILYILQGMQTIESVSCVRFFPASGYTKDFVKIKKGKSCSTRSGSSAAKRNLRLRVDPLDKGCFKKSNILAVLLQTVGLYAPHKSPNRDEYVTIEWDNIKENKLHLFQKVDPETVPNFGVGYDYDSILHYRPNAFSRNGQDTLASLRGDISNFGFQQNLSDGDIRKLNIMYNCIQ